MESPGEQKPGDTQVAPSEGTHEAFVYRIVLLPAPTHVYAGEHVTLSVAGVRLAGPPDGPVTVPVYVVV